MELPPQEEKHGILWHIKNFFRKIGAFFKRLFHIKPDPEKAREREARKARKEQEKAERKAEKQRRKAAWKGSGAAGEAERGETPASARPPVRRAGPGRTPSGVAPPADWTGAASGDMAGGRGGGSGAFGDAGSA